VHNEATDLEPRLRRLHAHLSALPFPFGPPRTGPGGLFVGLPIPSTKSMGTLTRPSQPSPAVTKLVDRDASSDTWVAPRWARRGRPASSSPAATRCCRWGVNGSDQAHEIGRRDPLRRQPAARRLRKGPLPRHSQARSGTPQGA
jgi:hypothetical protein